MTPSRAATLPDLDAMPASATIGRPDLSNILDCSEKHVHRLTKAGKLPPPIHVGRLLRWRVGTIRDWLRNGGHSETVA